MKAPILVRITQSPPGAKLDDIDVALLTTALGHVWAWYDARINRGLQVLNFYLVSMAILATAYVSALNSRLYAVAAVLGLLGAAATFAAYKVGRRQQAIAKVAELPPRGDPSGLGL